MFDASLIFCPFLYSPRCCLYCILNKSSAAKHNSCFTTHASDWTSQWNFSKTQSCTAWATFFHFSTSVPEICFASCSRAEGLRELFGSGESSEATNIEGSWLPLNHHREVIFYHPPFSRRSAALDSWRAELSVWCQQPGRSLKLWFGCGLSGRYVSHHSWGGLTYIMVELCCVALMLFLAKQHYAPE